MGSQGNLTGTKKVASKVVVDADTDTDDGKAEYTENYSTRRMPLTSASLATRHLAPTVPKDEELEYKRRARND